MKQLILILALFFLTKKDNKTIYQNNIDSSCIKIGLDKPVSKILYSRKNSNDSGWSIYMIDPNGSNEEVLIPFKSGQGEYNPAVSTNGETVIFNTYRYGGWKLALYDVKGKSVNRISPKSSYYTNGVFSPDGSKVAYERSVQRRSTHIFISNSDGTNEKMLTGKMGDENRIPSWTPNGESILFYSQNGNVNDIYSVNINSGQIKNLTKNKSGNDFGPSVSPNGKHVAFFSDRNGHLDMYVMDIDGRNQKNLTASLQNKNNRYNYFKDNNLFWMFKVSWSPNGESLVFSNIKSDNIDLFTIKKDGNDLKQITTSSRSELTPFWGSLKQ
ncbi:TolB family protein [Pontimicrobium aquaticum]|uniref:TolB protein n=1 Tax=Pontimicrobium aquaticum TaxID=2565367 RepID=A0A4U0F1R9_9FLAO|nr:PD40 domain-containing protein [Pontimicrobium aquaticum]TJY38220.1 hypothetical protein E5167_02910 [Pontimicrobium aquaticum]